MLAPQRQHRILQELGSAGTVRVAAMASLLGVSEMTVRRDVDALDSGGRLQRVHGGAARTGSYSALEPGFQIKSTQELAAKTAIAKEALRLLRPGMTLLLSGGTTTFELARLLPRTLDLTVATNSIMVANILATGVDMQDSGHPIRTLILGGERTPSEAMVGPVTTHAIRRLRADLCFMGVHGLDPLSGITSPNLLEAEVNTAMIRSAEHLVVLADASKYGLVALAGIAPLTAVNTLITDDRINTTPAGGTSDWTVTCESAAQELRRSVLELRIARLPCASRSATLASTHLTDGHILPATAPKGSHA
ncbi:DeoR/GlpR family DNA-binding transcription regulator [Pseudarthrobacter sp. N5]|uniref:DeoR/GlpR family DNA-binding transcription regulator n=1 Tax=Pseudarthrobacter sp. N5 TaxID=3418416 RepID=UPI003CF1A095